MSFSIGDIVRLKSGGPVMTVIEIGGLVGSTRYMHCNWFRAGDEVTGQAFPERALEVVSDK